jgi:hypothetical protein
LSRGDFVVGAGGPRYSPSVFKRVWFPLVALFWVIMNLLLWRSEMSASRAVGSPVPAEAVWDRILTAPDDSALEIFHRGRKVGWCRWVPKVEEAVAVVPGPETGDTPDAPEGRVTRVTGYSLTLDGNVALEDPTQRVRFSGQLEFDAGKRWRTFSLKLALRPNSFEVRADAAREEVTFQMGEKPNAWEQRFAFNQLAQPEAVLAAFGLPLPPGWLQTLLPGAARSDAPSLALGLRWEARQDWLQLGSARARAYRVAARLLDHHEAVAMISRVGEVLRLELPGGVSLVSEALVGF